MIRTLSPVFSALIEMELHNGNQGQGHSWHKTDRSKRAFVGYLRLNNLEREPFPHPVYLQITRRLGKGQRLWDFDSVLRGNAKQLIDAMVDCGWFADDSATYIKGVYGDQDSDHKSEGPGILVKVYDASPEKGG